MAITVTHDNISIECTKAIKCTNKCFIHCLDADNNIIAAFSKIEDFETFGISGGDWSEPDENAIADYSYARGTYAIASGTSATAIGSTATASGSYSRAEGRFCNATAGHAQAIGEGCDAAGKYSFAQGEEVKTSEDYQFATGSYNEDLSDSAFEIGRGENNDPFNIFRVTNAGKVEAAADIVAKAKDNSPVSLVDVAKLNTTTASLSCNGGAASSTTIRKRNGIVQFRLNVTAPELAKGTTYTIGTLPEGYRPIENMYFIFVIRSGTSYLGVGVGNVSTSGTIQIYATSMAGTGSLNINANVTFITN